MSLPTAQEIERRFRAMNTDVHVILVCDGAGWKSGAEAAFLEVERLFASVEATLSRFRPESELSRLNRNSGAPFTASPLLFQVVAEALEAARATDGLFDPTVLRALEAAGYDRSFDDLREGIVERGPVLPATARGQWRKVTLDPERRTIMLPEQCGLDLGGIAKGWTVDQAVHLLAGRGFRHFAVDAGGDLYAAGRQADGSPWHVGVEDPRAPERDLVLLQVEDCAVATSSICRRRWMRHGRAYHHLIDPRTGMPAQSGVLAATVLAPTVAWAEVLAKAVVFLGPHEGLRFLEQQPDAAGLLVPDSPNAVPILSRWLPSSCRTGPQESLEAKQVGAGNVA
jgi:thiamine biosynthesis lipoprotein